MSFENEKDADRRRRSDQPADVKARKNPQSKGKGPGSADVGSALRTVYQRTIDEQSPPDLLDLLGKLG